MRWLVKVLGFKILSLLPGGEWVHLFVQRNVTGSIRPTPDRVRQKLEVGLQYVSFLRRRVQIPAWENVVHVDIGCGWMPAIPILFYSLGVEQQLLCDIRRGLSRDLVAETVRVFREVAVRGMVATHETETKDLLRRLPPLVEAGEDLGAYLARLGIRYLAPYSDQDILQEPGFKVITCTQVLLHLSEGELLRLLRVAASALANGGGVLVGTVHLYDLWHDVDPSISKYNKYRYSDFVWERVLNSRLMRYNRLLASDYRRLLEAAGLKVVEFRVTGPSDGDLKMLKTTRRHPKFAALPEVELGANELFFAVTGGD